MNGMSGTEWTNGDDVNEAPVFRAFCLAAMLLISATGILSAGEPVEDIDVTIEQMPCPPYVCPPPPPPPAQISPARGPYSLRVEPFDRVLVAMLLHPDGALHLTLPTQLTAGEQISGSLRIQAAIGSKVPKRLATLQLMAGGADWPLTIEGPFDGMAATSRVTLLGVFHQAGLQLRASRSPIGKGDRATLELALDGLQGLRRPVRVDLLNLTPAIAALAGGDAQSLAAHPEAVTAEGRFLWTDQIRGRISTLRC